MFTFVTTAVEFEKEKIHCVLDWHDSDRNLVPGTVQTSGTTVCSPASWRGAGFKTRDGHLTVVLRAERCGIIGPARPPNTRPQINRLYT